ncbi:hypothetical protein RJT34_26762 [Clitoria ternatea]|uniref:Transmembrane protein n=1 Tax=Clitoria ternatea TaxID=43366 RepID=A0AAN9FC80_CLITE
MEKNSLLKFLVINFLCLFYVVYVVAVPATRSTLTRKVDPFVLNDQSKEEMVMDLRNSDEKKEGLEDGRMMMDIADYTPTGPNHSHTPPRKP